MARTLNGEVLIDDNGNLNEGLWLSNLLACAELLKDRVEEQKSENKEQEDENDSHREVRITMNKLRPCPFCKNNNVRIFNILGKPIEIVCNECHSIYPNLIDNHMESEDKA